MATVTADDLTREIRLLRSDPQKYLEMTEAFIKENPSDSYGYFKRHQIWMAMGDANRALLDMNKAVDLTPDAFSFEQRGEVLRHLGQYEKAIADFDRAEKLSLEDWEGGFGLLFRADCHARLGNEVAALADCVRLREDHWTPGPFHLPAGNKGDVATELRRLAAAARKKA